MKLISTTKKTKSKQKKAELLTQNCRKMSGTKDYNRLPYMDKN